MTELSHNGNVDSSSKQLGELLLLSKLARKAESSNALQFLLVNQTFRLCPYALAITWVSNEGVVSQSGVSSVERNAPFVQWVNTLCEQLIYLESPTIVTTAHLAEEQIGVWAEYLPSSVLWLPFDEASTKGGLLLCRSEPWLDQDLALLEEWVDVWSHAWGKWHSPSMHGELTKLWLKVRSQLPSIDELKAEASFLNQGGHHIYDRIITKPSAWPSLIKVGSSRSYKWLKKQFTFLRKLGWSGLLRYLKTEVVAIWRNPRRRLIWGLMLLALFPMHLSVLAPAELVPANPALIRSPIEGVIDEFFVTPNQKVTEGQLLFKLNLTTLTSRLNVAEQETQIAGSEYRQSSLQSLTDAKSRTQLVPQEGKAAQKRVEAEYLQDLLSKAQIKSPKSGVVLFDDPSEWIGKPVAAGEKVMVVANEGDVEIEAWIPVSDAIILPKDTSVVLYLNATPLSPVDGHLRYMGHEPILRPDGTYAYRLRAKLDPGESGARVGLKGTAKISGQYVPLLYLVLRKPLGGMRQFLGI